MGSNWRSGLPARALSRAQPEKTSVLVSLDALFPTDRPATQQHEGLVLTGWTAGVLHRWLRSATGQWIGCRDGLSVTVDRVDGLPRGR